MSSNLFCPLQYAVAERQSRSRTYAAVAQSLLSDFNTQTVPQSCPQQMREVAGACLYKHGGDPKIPEKGVKGIIIRQHSGRGKKRRDRVSLSMAVNDERSWLPSRPAPEGEPRIVGIDSGGGGKNRLVLGA